MQLIENKAIADCGSRVAKIFHITNLDSQFYYYLLGQEEQNSSIGDVVMTSLKNRKVIGIIFEISNLADCNISYNLKTIDYTICHGLLSENTVRFIAQMASYNIISINNILEAFINSGIIKIMNNKDKIIHYLNDIKHDYKYTETVIKLSNEQQTVCDDIINNINNFATSLIYGPTGSGKTYIFLSIINHLLTKDSTTQGTQILILVPEILLIYELYDKIIKNLNIKPIIWHSTISATKRRKAFFDIANGNVNIILATRSGLLLPYKNLKLIIIDEEHDSSYKQNEYPVYNARDMAVLYGKIHNIPIILSSATPAIDTIYNIYKKKYTMYQLTEKYFHNIKPNIAIIDIKKQKLVQEDGSVNYLTSDARQLIDNTIAKNEQILIFINRRGFTRTIKCSKCNSDVKCINCDNLLSFHKKRNLLKCHYCGFRKILDNHYSCESCGNNKFTEYGSPGVECIEKEINKHFHEIRTVILSSDELSINSDHIIQDIKDNKFNVIIGTQIATKGYHFPHLTGIVVIDIDNHSNSNDFRAFEKMFQLLVQIIGRAGRERDIANIIIQTADTRNSLLELIKKLEYEEFYIKELQDRKNANLPPFNRFVALIISAKNDQTAQSHASILSQFIREYIAKQKIQNIIILGPIESQIFYLKSQYRYRFLLKMPRDAKYLSVINHIVKLFDAKKQKIQLKVDVDPVSFV